MGLFSKIFKKEKKLNKRERPDEPDVYHIPDEDERMNWAIEKAKLTLHYFEKCLASPKKEQTYFSIKVKFEDEGKIEHIWLTKPSFDAERNLFGVVGNSPVNIKSVKLDQKIGVDSAFVSDWMIVENGRLIGGYTIRAVRDGFTGQSLADFDRSLGGMIVDEGEDYFLPNFETPEGAITKLEDAYDREDLDEAINCKDFLIEAKLMLEKMGKDLGEEVTIQTAEALKLSYIKSLQESGMPKFGNLKRAFPARKKINDSQYLITEVCLYPDGSKSTQVLNTFKTASGWRVLGVED
ncbi:DUF2314 domain-containing protein [Fulvivirgaceae bacterium BMA12]|uniref:DUF2314 domain-containing protein n=1 Tax=Agaribacillus aureus TaxID=3051825 RepID=A0ABT8LCL3_9BACT|nr:DUF2314 domain-containing protein [Fulvivirgaceae bacterium BMA12]